MRVDDYKQGQIVKSDATTQRERFLSASQCDVGENMAAARVLLLEDKTIVPQNWINLELCSQRRSCCVRPSSPEGWHNKCLAWVHFQELAKPTAAAFQEVRAEGSGEVPRVKVNDEMRLELLCALGLIPLLRTNLRRKMMPVGPLLELLTFDMVQGQLRVRILHDIRSLCFHGSLKKS